MTYHPFTHVAPLETFVLADSRKGSARTLAEIRLAQALGGWITSEQADAPTAGFAGPLGYGQYPHVYPTRSAALLYAIARIRKFAEGEGQKATLKWLDALEATEVTAKATEAPAPCTRPAVEPLTLANGTYDQLLIAGIAPTQPLQRDLAALVAKRAMKRQHAPMPAGGLFGGVAAAQPSLF